ncbi:MAG: metalloregulator ArsR/SmtB family transcription factor [Gammaproteobacteria bacterium]|nr:metalloregulator ArsR/SmtB family transcription factor [Gammaproteobacteria bacterium]
MADINALAGLFKAFSEPVRLRIVSLLLDKGELCVCDLVSTLSLSQGVVSRHLAYLRNSGLVSTRREGVWVYYRMSAMAHEDVQPVLSFLQMKKHQVREMQADSAQLKSARTCAN